MSSVSARILFFVLAIGCAKSFADVKDSTTKKSRPNLNGIWQSMNEANWNVETHNSGPSPIPKTGAMLATPPSIGVVEGGQIPYKAEALLKRKQNFENRLSLDPENKCYLPGVPRAMYIPLPFQIVQSDDVVMMFFTYAGAVRTVYMNGPNESKGEDLWMGWSVGHWEGQTLVIDTTHFNNQTWFDRVGNFHSDALRTVERISVRSKDVLNYEVTIEDPNVFTKPWKMRMPLYRRLESGMKIMEYKCPQYAEELLYGHLRKQKKTDK